MAQELQAFKADFFKALANPLRIRILELLRDGDKYVHEIQEHMGIESAVVSQQLAILRAKNIVIGVKEGTRVMYSVKDPLLFDLLDVAKRIFHNSLSDTIQMLQEMNDEELGP
ncbi:MAG: metalloregulator ArsR/SmtB family transcription factor [Alicyclobacillaceae bacterium]|jgi:DNA-binding transcriptional ArsR family regulator|uniref:ArsR/SmtB family transcription factor n=1 Tax=Alicyclobacillus sp. SP_1 TaxID=2942475 RepID=UPI002157F130|nr:metalloregulator ArsR/SmtB family transcription factor [Alicyclobacillus sp. SP_1]MCY0888169.1 metalloregulator ArsR/SmtB family transcription factor [Alicyclobacillaceae bacterium]MCY0896487.1 metalloregulator ArsR/SmtB family transcription factor [Alicyclobacillaceae bacterium]